MGVQKGIHLPSTGQCASFPVYQYVCFILNYSPLLNPNDGKEHIKDVSGAWEECSLYPQLFLLFPCVWHTQHSLAFLLKLVFHSAKIIFIKGARDFSVAKVNGNFHLHLS